MPHSRLLRTSGALLITIGLFAGLLQPALAATWVFTKNGNLDFPNLVNLYPSVVDSPSGDFYLAYLHSDMSIPVQELAILKWNDTESSWKLLHTLTPSTGNINITNFIDYLALVVRSDNDIHLVFRGEKAQVPFGTSTSGIYYGHYDGTAWSVEAVEVITNPSTKDPANYTTLAVDTTGTPHVAYVISELTGASLVNRLVYAVKTQQGAWTKEPVQVFSSGSEFVRYPLIVLDHEGHASIIYNYWFLDLTDQLKVKGRLYLSNNASGEWTHSILVGETPQATNAYLTPYDLRADSDGKLHLTYIVSHFTPLNTLVTDSFYGTNAGESWEISQVPGYTGNDGGPRIALNTQGVKILTYVSYNAGGNELKVATRSGSGSWQVETADTSKEITGVSTTALNDNHQVMIVEERMVSSTSMKQFWYATTSLIDDTAPAAPVITAPTDGGATNDKKPTFTGTAEANSTVTLSLGGEETWTTTADGAGNWTFTLPTDLADGEYSAQASAQDAAGNRSAASTTTFTVDTVPPIASLSTTAPDSIHAGPIYVTITFSEPVSGFDLEDLLVRNGTASAFTGSGNTYFVTLTGQGDVSVQVPAQAGFDAANNPNLASNVLVQRFDRVAPALSSIDRVEPSPTNAEVVHYTVTFSEPVSGVDLEDFTDFTLWTDGLTGAKIQAVTGSGNAYTVAVTTGSGTGSLRLDLADDGSIQDVAGNWLLQSGTLTGNPYQIDRTLPEAQLLAHTELPSSGSDAYIFTVRYTDNLGMDPNKFGNGDLSMAGTAATLVSVEVKAGPVYEVTYRIAAPAAGWQSLTGQTHALVLEANQVSDLAGNFLAQSVLGSVDRANFKIHLPVVTFP